jgi:hypothetical protein
VNIEDFDWERLEGLGFAEKTKEGLKSACWKGYEAVGMKNKGGKKVPNCVPVKKSEHSEPENPINKMTDKYLPALEIPGGGDKKDMMMGEGVDYSETVDFNDAFHSMEPNARMLITQLRVAREKIDIMLGMMYPDDNFEPWVATKVANAGVALASVADYLRFGGET